MYRCPSCGKEFGRKDNLERHRGSGACVKSQAMAVVRRSSSSSRYSSPNRYLLKRGGGGIPITKEEIQRWAVAAPTTEEFERRLEPLYKPRRRRKTWVEEIVPIAGAVFVAYLAYRWLRRMVKETEAEEEDEGYWERKPRGIDRLADRVIPRLFPGRN